MNKKDMDDNDLSNMLQKLMDDGYMEFEGISDLVVDWSGCESWPDAFSRATGLSADEVIEIYKSIKIDCRPGQKVIMINKWCFAADKEMVRLLEELNKFGFITTQHCSGHKWTDEDGDECRGYPYLSFDLNEVEYREFAGELSAPVIPLSFTLWTL